MIDLMHVHTRGMLRTLSLTVHSKYVGNRLPSEPQEQSKCSVMHCHAMQYGLARFHFWQRVPGGKNPQV